MRPYFASGGFAELSGEVAELSGEVAELSGEVAELSGEVAELSGEVAELSGEVAELSGEVAELSGEVAAYSTAQFTALSVSRSTVSDTACLLKPTSGPPLPGDRARPTKGGITRANKPRAYLTQNAGAKPFPVVPAFWALPRPFSFV
jgi:outer membrane murein-binding lipoprotein Lpp